MSTSIERACRRLAEDVIDSDCSLCSDSVSALAADLQSFAADWVRTEKLRLLRDSVRRSVGLVCAAPALVAAPLPSYACDIDGPTRIVEEDGKLVLEAAAEATEEEPERWDGMG